MPILIMIIVWIHFTMGDGRYKLLYIKYTKETFSAFLIVTVVMLRTFLYFKSFS